MTAPLRFEEITLPGLDESSLSLEVPPHHTVSVLGTEASGVDTLTRYALALVRPASGRAFVFGQDLAELPHGRLLAFRRRVGYLPAGDGLLHNLSLAENVALPMRFGSRMTEREISGRIRIMLAQLRLTEVGDARPADVTEELRRRTALARARAFDPELVILEDPFDGLTTRVAAQLLEIVRGGDTSEGSRRTVFMTGQSVPQRLEARIEIRYRIGRGRLQIET